MACYDGSGSKNLYRRERSGCVRLHRADAGKCGDTFHAPARHRSAHGRAFLTSMLDALGQALVSQHEVIVQHPDNDAEIYSVELR